LTGGFAKERGKVSKERTREPCQANPPKSNAERVGEGYRQTDRKTICYRRRKEPLEIFYDPDDSFQGGSKGRPVREKLTNCCSGWTQDTLASRSEEEQESHSSTSEGSKRRG